MNMEHYREFLTAGLLMDWLKAYMFRSPSERK